MLPEINLKLSHLKYKRSVNVNMTNILPSESGHESAEYISLHVSAFLNETVLCWAIFLPQLLAPWPPHLAERSDLV